MTAMLTTAWLWPFLLAATLLAALFAASLVWAGAPHSGRAPRGQALALLLAAPLALVVLYAALGHPRALNPAEREPGSAEQVEAMMQRLAERLQREPADTAGWLMLARSQKVLGRHAAAAEAYERAGDAARLDPDLLADWIEARVLAAEQHFDTRSRALLAEALRLAPDHPGVVLMRGLAALDRGDPEAAARAFRALRDQYPADSPDREALDQALARLAQGQDPRPATDARRAPTPTPMPAIPAVPSAAAATAPSAAPAAASVP